ILATYLGIILALAALALSMSVPLLRQTKSLAAAVRTPAHLFLVNTVRDESNLLVSRAKAMRSEAGRGLFCRAIPQFATQHQFDNVWPQARALPTALPRPCGASQRNTTPE